MSTPEKFTKDLTPAANETVKKFGWPFFRAGVLIVDEWHRHPYINDDKEHQYPNAGGYQAAYLLVREAKVKEFQPDGTAKWVKSNQGKWNLPCGRLQPGESIEAAALREGQEETGHSLRLGTLCHIGHRADNNNPYVIFIYTAESVNIASSPDPEEIADVAWLTYDQILDLRDAGQLRNAALTMSVINMYRSYDPCPCILPTTYPSKS